MSQYDKRLAPARSSLRRLGRSHDHGRIRILVAALLLGIVGYHCTEGLSWLDSLLNASMILGGMGPVSELHTVAGKYFASFYALFSGVIFISSVAVLLGPLVHRFLHKFHLDLEKSDSDKPE